LRLAVGLTRMDVITPAVLRRRYGRTTPDDADRNAFMAALVLRTSGLRRVDGVLREGQIERVTREKDRIVVPASEAFGVTLDFRD
jgi:hypothetical protein